MSETNGGKNRKGGPVREGEKKTADLNCGSKKNEREIGIKKKGWVGHERALRGLSTLPAKGKKAMSHQGITAKEKMKQKWSATEKTAARIKKRGHGRRLARLGGTVAPNQGILCKQ